MEELRKIQQAIEAPKNLYNSFSNFYYRSCESILESAKPLLDKYKCFITLNDECLEIAGVLVIKATATIENSEGKTKSVSAFAGIEINKKGMDLSQSFGSSSSYARKYALNGLLLIDDTKDADTQDNTHSNDVVGLTDEPKLRGVFMNDKDNRRWFNLNSKEHKQLNTIYKKYKEGDNKYTLKGIKIWLDEFDINQKTMDEIKKLDIELLTI